MKKALFLFAVCLGLYLVAFSPAVSAADKEETIEMERVIVGFNQQIDLTVFEGIPCELHYVHEYIDAVSISIPAASVESLRQNGKIKWIEFDRQVKTTGQLTDWGFEATVLPETRQWNFTGAGVKVAVIDTGISKTHPDLKVAGGVSFVEDVPSYHDDNGHGTHVAGVIAARDNEVGTVGVAPDAEIYAVKTLDQYGKGNHIQIVAGIEWAIKQEMDIINLSVSGPYPSTAIENAVETAAANGILILAASGNDETGLGQIDADIMYPARYPATIAVGSISQALKHSAFSYFGPSLDFAAPGENIYSTYIENGGTKDGYSTMSGTSMATPYVAGVLALYKQAYPSLGLSNLKSIISKKAVDLGVRGKDPVYGYGMLTSPSSLFWDLKTDDWFAAPVTYLIQEKLVNGYPDQSFQPNGMITRGEAVTMVGRALGLDGMKRATVFQDVQADYFASGYIASATEAEFINGYPGNTFAPKANITRGEVATVIRKAFGFPESDRQTFADVKPDKFYYGSVNSLFDARIITGYPEQGYQPDRNITRAEFSAVLSKAINESMR